LIAVIGKSPVGGGGTETSLICKWRSAFARHKLGFWTDYKGAKFFLGGKAWPRKSGPRRLNLFCLFPVAPKGVIWSKEKERGRREGGLFWFSGVYGDTDGFSRPYGRNFCPYGKRAEACGSRFFRPSADDFQASKWLLSALSF